MDNSSQSISIFDKKLNYCKNCGKKGHILRNCKESITSLGIIAFKKNKNKIEYLLIRRKNSIGFVEFISGRYNLNNIDYLYKIFNEMTIHEKNLILKKTFNYLWGIVWQNTYGKKYNTAKYKFNKIKKGYLINDLNVKIENIITKSNTNWIEPEWGFPKGRRNYYETDFQAANREFIEETNIKKNEYKIVNNFTYIEEYKGSNNKIYKHIYYLAKYKGNGPLLLTNKHQKCEISELGFYSYTDCLGKIRKYHEDKIKVLTKIHYYLINNKYN